VRVASGEATVLELAKPFEMTQPAISQYLKVREEAKLIVTRVSARSALAGWQRPALKQWTNGWPCCAKL